MTTPRRMECGMEGGEECERGVFRAKRKRERVPARPIERHQEVAEAMFRGAEPREAKLHEVEVRQPWNETAFRPCGTRAAFAATSVAARPETAGMSLRVMPIIRRNDARNPFTPRRGPRFRDRDA